MNEFHGVHAAAITPRGRQGDLDFGAAFELIDHIGRGGAQGILLFGEEGEYPAFSLDERSRLVYLAVKRSRVPVLAAVGAPTLDMSVDLAREALYAGAAAILLPPPSFFRYQPEDIAEFCLQFAKQMERGSSLLLYNTPFSTSEIPIDTILALLDTGEFAGVADASGDSRVLACLKEAARSRDIEVLFGSDELFVEGRSFGFGALSSIACAIPELPVRLDYAIAEANQPEIDRLSGLLREFLDWGREFPPPVLIKTATELRGLKTGSLPVPLSSRKQKLLCEFREWFRAWLPAVKRQTANA